MSKKTYSVLVIGAVERRVIVSGGSLAEAEANAYSEWTNLTGGHIGTAECIEAHELEEDDNGRICCSQDGGQVYCLSTRR